MNPQNNNYFILLALAGYLLLLAWSNIIN